MANTTRIELLPNIFLRAVQTDKFKSAYLSVSFMTALESETASVNALIPDVLRRGCEAHPDMQAISAILDQMYGGVIEPVVRKKGDIHCIGMGASVLDDRFTPDGTTVLASVATLMGQLLLHPVTEQGVFRRDYVESERANLVDQIRSNINDKRGYALQRLVEVMCWDEAYGVDSLGDEKSALAITPESLWAQYKTLLKTAEVEVFYCGSAPIEQVAEVMKSALASLPLDGERKEVNCDVRVSAEPQPRIAEEAMDVAQGKLAMGFRTGGITIWEREFPALVMMNAIFGGTAMSKLFMNVRERLSLCYYASSGIEKMKGILLISSGVEFEKRDEAQSEILAQLDAIRRGEIEDWELEGARRILVGGYRGALDSQGRQEDFWLTQSIAGLEGTVEDMAQAIEAVTREEVVAVANRLELDTIYFLKGLEV